VAFSPGLLRAKNNIIMAAFQLRNRHRCDSAMDRQLLIVLPPEGQRLAALHLGQALLLRRQPFVLDTPWHAGAAGVRRALPARY